MASFTHEIKFNLSTVLGTFVMPDQDHKFEPEKVQLEIEEKICNQKMLLKLKI